MRLGLIGLGATVIALGSGLVLATIGSSPLLVGPWGLIGWTVIAIGLTCLVIAVLPHRAHVWLGLAGPDEPTDAQRAKLHAFQEADQATRIIVAMVASERNTRGPSQLPEMQRRLTAQLDALVRDYPEERDRVRIADANGIDGPDGLLATLDAIVRELTPKRPRGLRFPRRSTHDR